MNRILSSLPLLFAIVLWVTPSNSASAQASTKRVVFIIAEDQYQASETLPAFAKKHLKPSLGFESTFLLQDANNKYHIPGMSKLKGADLVVLYVRRRSLPATDMALFRHYLAQGKPLLALRTSSHAWDTRNRGPKEQEEWKSFDPEVLGGNYLGHHANHIESHISIVPGMQAHPILEGVDAKAMIGKGSLYKASPLSAAAQVLLIGTIPNEPAEPILWRHAFGKSQIIYTSLGHVGDFAQPGFNRILLNSIQFLLKD